MIDPNAIGIISNILPSCEGGPEIKRNIFEFPKLDQDNQADNGDDSNNDQQMYGNSSGGGDGSSQCDNQDYSGEGGNYDDCEEQCQDESCEGYQSSAPTPSKPRNEIIYKSSKEMYKAVAKECGITCKMSDQCRCLDCQSRYFDCEYEQVSGQLGISEALIPCTLLVRLLIINY